MSETKDNHCARYPGCGCSPEIGNYCHLSDKDMIDLKNKKGILEVDFSAPKEEKPETPIIPMMPNIESEEKLQDIAKAEDARKKEDEKIMQGIYKMCSLAMLQQSMILFEGFTKTHAYNVGTNLYNERVEQYKKKGFRDALKRASREAISTEKNVLKSTESIRNKAAEMISQTLIQLNDDARRDFEKYSNSVGEAALMMMKMDNPRKAKILIKMYNEGMFNEVFKTIEEIDKAKEEGEVLKSDGPAPENQKTEE